MDFIYGIIGLAVFCAVVSWACLFFRWLMNKNEKSIDTIRRASSDEGEDTFKDSHGDPISNFHGYIYRDEM
jgi:hypothetical protein